MKLGFKLVIYILILNIVSGLVYSLTVPGSSYSYAMTGTGNTTEYEQRLNSTEFMEKQQPGIISQLPFLGNIYGTIMMLWNAIKFVIIGFPLMLAQLGGFITDESGRTAYNIICGAIGAVFSLIIFGWLFQIITGRQTED